MYLDLLVEDLLLLLVEDVLLLRVLQEALVLLGGVDLLELLALLCGHQTPPPNIRGDQIPDANSRSLARRVYTGVKRKWDGFSVERSSCDASPVLHRSPREPNTLRHESKGECGLAK
ncbi:hypothetical protein EYF80_061416 [Liparis tanakae]|uniref:Uncharacterized protein n=1 Tax=Liparis tanakae TaxID=230148 RepID=A0A4Z2EI39_9TELE|nr:hypothetical protein EYF80_061416 [Liparis tanakae]